MAYQHTPFTPTPEMQLSEFVYKTPLAGLYFLAPKDFPDDRGFYAELARIPEIEKETGEQFVAKQLNLSHSITNVIRGFHAENWNKLITVTTGTAYCVWVDVRPESPTFGNSVGMSQGTGTGATLGSMFVQKGLANSICVVEGPIDYLYAVDQLYAERDTSGDIALSLFDPELAIQWPLNRESMIISQRDLEAKSLKEMFPSHA